MAARAALWGDTPDAEIERRLTLTEGLPPAMFADQVQAESGDIPVRIVPIYASIPADYRGAEAACGIWQHYGVLTCNHAASSYGQMVLLIDGVPHGLGDPIYPYAIGAILRHPNPAPEWRTPEFEGALHAATAQGWPLQGEEW